MGRADSGEPQQPKVQEDTDQETPSGDSNTKTSQPTYEYHLPHETQEEVRERLKSNNPKHIVLKNTIYGVVLGLVVASFISFANNSVILFGATIALGGIAGSVYGLDSALPEQIYPGVNEAAVHQLSLYVATTLIGGLVLSIPIGIMAVVVTALFSTSFSIGHIASLGVAVAALLMLPVVAIHGYDHYVESYFQAWEDRFDRANSLSNKIDELETEFQRYDKIYEKVEKANPHLYSTQEEVDDALNASESYIDRLRKWDELASQYQELYSNGLDLGKRFDQTDQILSTIGPADPEKYERHIVAEVEPATKSIESANTYIESLQKLEERCDSLYEWDDKCVYDIDEVDIFFDRIAHFDFSSDTSEIGDLVQRAEALISLLQEWNDLANRYEEANANGVALAKRFDHTEEIRAKLHQYDPKLYEHHGLVKLDEAQSRVEACEEYVSNLSELSDLLESAQQRNEKTSSSPEILSELIDKIRAVEPTVDSSTVERLTEEANQVNNGLGAAERKAELQERVVSKPHHVYQRDRGELLRHISAIDILSNPSDAQERLDRYTKVVECLERADEISTRLPSSVSESLNSELQEVIRSEDILDDAEYERVEHLLELFSSSEQIADLLEDTNQEKPSSDETPHLYEFESMLDRYQPETSTKVSTQTTKTQLPAPVEPDNTREEAGETVDQNTPDLPRDYLEADRTSPESEANNNTALGDYDESCSYDEDIIDVNGVTETVATSLRQSGYNTERDLREATMEELAGVDDLSEQIAMRIKLDVGE